MKVISKFAEIEKGMRFMQKTITQHTPSSMIWKAVSGVLICASVVYYVVLYMQTIQIGSGSSPLPGLYTVLNPFTTGAYLLGIAVLLCCTFFSSRFLKVVLCLFYGLVIFVSLAALMGADSMLDLLIYVPHLFIIGAIVYTFVKTTKKNASAK